jgi:hypothetical protein
MISSQISVFMPCSVLCTSCASTTYSSGGSFRNDFYSESWRPIENLESRDNHGNLFSAVFITMETMHIQCTCYTGASNKMDPLEKTGSYSYEQWRHDRSIDAKCFPVCQNWKQVHEGHLLHQWQNQNTHCKKPATRPARTWVKTLSMNPRIS